MQLVFKPFDLLTPRELYEAVRLRNEVFVVEQNCVFQDADGKDGNCFHLLIYKENVLVAYSRLVPPGISYPEPSIGRVVTSLLVRRKGMGRILMNQSIERLYGLYGRVDIKIGAQLYLHDFYGSFGFKQCSEVYDEDGIEHIEMLLKASSLPLMAAIDE